MFKFKYHEVGIRVFNLIIKGEYIYETLRKLILKKLTQRIRSLSIPGYVITL